MKRVITVLTLLATAAAAPAQDWFSDDFEDGVIDIAHWEFGGDISESNGYLNLDRDDPGDFIRTIATYGGDYVVELDIRLNAIHWNDMYHGLDISNDAGTWGAGISFGFSRYGQLYMAVHAPDGNGIGYYYGPNGSNAPGTWQHWAFEKTGSDIAVLVNGTPAAWTPPPGVVFIPDDAKIRLPGHYEDGDGGGHVGTTSSDVDVFSIEETVPVGAPETPGGLAGRSWGDIKGLF